MRGEEAKLKAKIKAHLNSLGAYWYMPVPFGYGKQTLDFLCCIKGRLVAIETKSPGKKPTRRQELTIEQIRHAGGIAFWCDSYDQYIALINGRGVNVDSEFLTVIHDLLP